jgi:hypothetical protein
MFGKDISMVIEPVDSNKIVFACDPNYWSLYSKYLLVSCDNLNLSVHVHILDNDLEFLKSVKDFILSLKGTHSLSYESIDTTMLEYPKFSYYFTARYFIADYLFKKYNIDQAIIIDADIILNDKIGFPENKDIGIFYRPYEEKPFRKIWGNLFMVKKSKSWFLEKIIEQYNLNFNSIDWKMVHSLKGKKRVQQYSGQDQICIAETIHHVEQDDGFFNLKSSKLFGPVIWSLTGDGQKSNPETYQILKNRFGF